MKPRPLSRTAVRQALSVALRPVRRAVYHAAPSGVEYDPRKLPIATAFGVTFTGSRLYAGRTTTGPAWYFRFEGTVPAEPFPCRRVICSDDLGGIVEAVFQHARRAIDESVNKPQNSSSTTTENTP